MFGPITATSIVRAHSLTALLSENARLSPVLVCFYASLAFCAPAGGAAAQSGTEVVARIVAEAAQEKVLKATTTGFGKVQSEPAKVISLDAPHAAVVTKVFVRPGQAVPQGSPVAEIAAAAATQEAFRKAETALEFARTKVERTQYLWKRGATTKDLLDQAEIAFKNAEAGLEAQKRIGAQNSQQTITAPISGTVTAVSVAQGDQVLQNAPILSLTPTNALAVLLGVEPEDVTKVQVGMPVVLTPAMGGGARYSGSVIAVNQVIDPQTRLVDVMVRIDNPDGHPPLIGTEMRGEIELRREQTLAVPRAAVLYDSAGAYIFTVRNDRARRVSVTPGLDGGGVIGITGPVKAGDLVAVQGNYELNDGMKVEQVPHAVP